mgnify:CR=1 FL=1
MIRPLEPPLKVVEQIGQVCLDGLVGGLGVLLASALEFAEGIDPFLSPLVDGVPEVVREGVLEPFFAIAIA